eukprot:s5095_g1.t2
MLRSFHSVQDQKPLLRKVYRMAAPPSERLEGLPALASSSSLSVTKAPLASAFAATSLPSSPLQIAIPEVCEVTGKEVPGEGASSWWHRRRGRWRGDAWGHRQSRGGGWQATTEHRRADMAGRDHDASSWPRGQERRLQLRRQGADHVHPWTSPGGQATGRRRRSQARGGCTGWRHAEGEGHRKRHGARRSEMRRHQGWRRPDPGFDFAPSPAC